MGIGRYLVDAIVLEGRSPTQLARANGVSVSWTYELLKRFKQGGYEALEPRSRRPHSCPQQIDLRVQDLVLALRKELSTAGHDAGPDTILHHLRQRISSPPSVTTVWRILKRNGLITPQPHKRPRSSFIRFVAKLPNETWQADSTPWHLADGTEVEILNFLDDHSRLALACRCFRTVKGHDVVTTFDSASKAFGLPASLLTDNGRVFTAKSGGGKNALEHRLQHLGINAKHSTPYHPQTCGKVERFHQTLKRFLVKQQAPQSLAELQLQLDTFRDYYNSVRPHRALDRQTPLAVFNSHLKASPKSNATTLDHRVRRDKIDRFGKVTLRYQGKLRHIAVGIAHKNRRVRLLVAGPNVRIVSDDGLLIRALVLDEKRDYQPLGGRWPLQNVLQQASGMS